MSILDILDDFVLGPLNMIDRLEGMIKGIMYKDMGYQLVIPRYDKGGKLTLNEAEAILRTYGVEVYRRTHDSQNMYFNVKKRQARWAEYLLLHAGAELRNPTFDDRNPGYVATHAPGWMPVPWSHKQQKDKIDDRSS